MLKKLWNKSSRGDKDFLTKTVAKWIRTKHATLMLVTTIARDIEHTLRVRDTLVMFRMYRWFMEDVVDVLGMIEGGPCGRPECDDRLFYIQQVLSTILRTLQLHTGKAAVGCSDMTQLCKECMEFLTSVCLAAGNVAHKALSAMVQDIASTLLVFLDNIETQGPVQTFLEKMLGIETIRVAVSDMQPFPSKYSKLELLRKSARREESSIFASVEKFLHHCETYQQSVLHIPGLQALHQAIKSCGTLLQTVPVESLTRWVPARFLCRSMSCFHCCRVGIFEKMSAKLWFDCHVWMTRYPLFRG